MERGMECVKEGPCVRRDFVEGQNATGLVQIDSYSGGAGGGHGYVSLIPIVASDVSFVIAVQTPGLLIASKETVTTPSSSVDPSVGHSNINFPSFPLYFPVTS